ncbi:MAG: DMT family transporter [Deltaproteobacteria bacterium]|nr:DMT family transporter [Deltaproteobacteria bacterium]
MPAELFALANAFLFALHNMLTKKGLRYSNPATAVVTSLGINTVFLWGVSLLFVPLESLTKAGIFIFVIAGLFQPGLTRFLTYKGIETLGIAITDPVRASTPLFSALFAILFLGERMTLPIFFATLLIIAGITLLSHRGGGSVQKIRLLYILYPLMASLIAGFSQVLRKFGLAAVPHPFLAAAVTASSSFAVSVLLLLASGGRKSNFNLNRECLPFYLAAGVTVSLGMASMYYALDLGKVTVVVPLSGTGPLFALALSAIFLRDVERVTLKIVMGACLIIGGGLLITIWK